MKKHQIEGGRLASAASSFRSVRTSIAVSLIDLKLARVIMMVVIRMRRIIIMSSFTIIFQLMAVTASAYLVAWGPFSVLCIWEMVVQPKVLINHDDDDSVNDGVDLKHLYSKRTLLNSESFTLES